MEAYYFGDTNYIPYLIRSGFKRVDRIAWFGDAVNPNKPLIVTAKYPKEDLLGYLLLVTDVLQRNVPVGIAGKSSGGHKFNAWSTQKVLEQKGIKACFLKQTVPANLKRLAEQFTQQKPKKTMYTLRAGKTWPENQRFETFNLYGEDGRAIFRYHEAVSGRVRWSVSKTKGVFVQPFGPGNLFYRDEYHLEVFKKGFLGTAEIFEKRFVLSEIPEPLVVWQGGQDWIVCKSILRELESEGLFSGYEAIDRIQEGWFLHARFRNKGMKFPFEEKLFAVKSVSSDGLHLVDSI